MAAPSIAIDGTQSYGSYSIALSGGTTFIFDDVKITRAVEEASDMGITGLPARARYTAGRAEGTATLQIGTSGVRPQFGETFSQAFDTAGYGTELWVVMPVDFEASSAPGEIRKAPITFKKVYSGSVTTVA